jgi:hypothetical protein
VQTVLEGIATIHHDKVKYGQIRSEFLLKQVFLTQDEEERAKMNDEIRVYTEQEKSFLSIFS